MVIFRFSARGIAAVNILADFGASQKYSTAGYGAVRAFSADNALFKSRAGCGYFIFGSAGFAFAADCFLTDRSACSGYIGFRNVFSIASSADDSSIYLSGSANIDVAFGNIASCDIAPTAVNAVASSYFAAAHRYVAVFYATFQIPVTVNAAVNFTATHNNMVVFARISVRSGVTSINICTHIAAANIRVVIFRCRNHIRACHTAVAFNTSVSEYHAVAFGSSFSRGIMYTGVVAICTKYAGIAYHLCILIIERNGIVF